MPEPTALLRKALLDLLVIGAAADLRASHHSTFHASARKLFAPGPIHKLRPRAPDPPALARIVLIDVRPDVDERHASKLHAVAANLCEKLPGTPVVFFHHSAAAAAAAALARAHACVTATTAVDAQIRGLEGFRVGRNVLQYNAMLKTEAFWKSTGEDRDTVLLAQADSGVCGAGAAVEAFARYDYCGAVTHYGVAWAPTQNGGFSIRNVGCMRRVTRAFAAGAFRDGNTRHGGIGISAARPGGVNEDAFFTQGAALFCDKCPAAVAREFAEETLHVHNATTREPVWTSTGVSGERVAKVLFPRRRAWGFHKNWNYGKHAARRRAWEKAGVGPAPPPYDPDIATCAANRALADLHVAPAPHGGGPARCRAMFQNDFLLEVGRPARTQRFWRYWPTCRHSRRTRIHTVHRGHKARFLNTRLHLIPRYWYGDTNGTTSRIIKLLKSSRTRPSLSGFVNRSCVCATTSMQAH